MHPQEAPREAFGAHADPRDHAACQPARHLAGGVHRRRGASQAHRYGAVLAQEPERQETRRDWVHAPARAHDHVAHDQTVQAGTETRDARDTADGRRGRAQGDGAREHVPAQVCGRAALHRAGGEAPPLCARGGGVLVRRGGSRRAGLDHRLRVVLLAAVDGDPGSRRARHAARGVLVLQRAREDGHQAAHGGRADPCQVQGL